MVQLNLPQPTDTMRTPKFTGSSVQRAPSETEVQVLAAPNSVLTLKSHPRSRMRVPQTGQTP